MPQCRIQGDGQGSGGCSSMSLNYDPAPREPKANPLPKSDERLRVRYTFHPTLGPVPYAAEPLSAKLEVGGWSAGSVGVAGEGEFLDLLLFWEVVFGPEVGVLGLVGVVVFDHHLIGDVVGGLSTTSGVLRVVDDTFSPGTSRRPKRSQHKCHPSS